MIKEGIINRRGVFMEKKWKFKISGVDGNCILFGVNIFKYKWIDTGENVVVIDPLYHQEHTFSVYKVKIMGITRTFAAGEFSNCVWGFYT